MPSIRQLREGLPNTRKYLKAQRYKPVLGVPPRGIGRYLKTCEYRPDTEGIKVLEDLRVPPIKEGH